MKGNIMNKKYLKDGRAIDLIMKITDVKTKNIKYLVSDIFEYYDSSCEGEIEYSNENSMYFVDTVFIYKIDRDIWC